MHLEFRLNHSAVPQTLPQGGFAGRRNEIITVLEDGIVDNYYYLLLTVLIRCRGEK
jgi:hypothetical protein